MTRKLKVCLNGTENNGWAMDEEMAHVHDALSGKVEFTDLEECEILHSVYWWKLLQLPARKLKGKKVICSISNKPYHEFTEPLFMNFKNQVGLIIAKSNEAVEEFGGVGVDTKHITYSVNNEIFYPMSQDSKELLDFQKKWNIPKDRYLIGNFHRDSEGQNVKNPKVQKGPEVFYEMVKRIHKFNPSVHIVLAGPRRHWLKENLTKSGIPWTYIGEELADDDNHVNILPREVLNLLYNTIDLYLISSRWEGGPHSVIEAAAARCKVISTRVGVAMDILEPIGIFDTLKDGIVLVQNDIDRGVLNQTVELQYQRFLNNHTIDEVGKEILSIYSDIESIPVNSSTYSNSLNDDRLGKRVERKIRRSLGVKQRGIIRFYIESETQFWRYFGFEDVEVLRIYFRDRDIEVLDSPKDADVVLTSWNNSTVLSAKQKLLYWVCGEFLSSDTTEDEAVKKKRATLTLFNSPNAFQTFNETLGYPVRPVLLTDTSFYQLRKQEELSSVENSVLVLFESNSEKDKSSIDFSSINCSYDSISLEDDSSKIEHKSYTLLVDLTNGNMRALHHDFLHAGIPIIGAKDSEVHKLVTYGGLSHDSTSDSIVNCIDSILSDYELYHNLILTPDAKRLAGKLCELVEESLFQDI